MNFRIKDDSNINNPHSKDNGDLICEECTCQSCDNEYCEKEKKNYDKTKSKIEINNPHSKDNGDLICEECTCQSCDNEYCEKEKKNYDKIKSQPEIKEKYECHCKNSELENNKEQSAIEKQEQLKKENQKLKEQLISIKKEYENNKLKLQADLENFQKRIQKEKTAILKYASMDFIKDILVPLEQFETVLEIPSQEKNKILNQFLLGFKMINQQIKEVLAKEGVQEIKALGEKFNPKLHHAVEKISDPNQPNGVNVIVLKKGFLYKDLVLSPTMVKINEWSKENENK